MRKNADDVVAVVGAVAGAVAESFAAVAVAYNDDGHDDKGRE